MSRSYKVVSHTGKSESEIKHLFGDDFMSTS